VNPIAQSVSEEKEKIYKSLRSFRLFLYFTGILRGFKVFEKEKRKVPFIHRGRRRLAVVFG